VRITIILTVTAMAIGIILGLIIAVMRQSENWVLSSVAGVYIWFFRATPALVQLIFWFNLAALFPHLSFGIPFGPSFVSGDANKFITPLIAANLGLGLCEAAFMAEIMRGGLLSVDAGQLEAAHALGMSRLKALRHVVLPQAMRVIIPPTGNETIGMLKYTSLASVISVTELLESAQIIYQRTFQPIPLLIVASIWYLAMTSALTIGQRYLERKFGRGVQRRGSGRAWAGFGRTALSRLPRRSIGGAR
jgi:polar amino acid transport system permease protein